MANKGGPTKKNGSQNVHITQCSIPRTQPPSRPGGSGAKKKAPKPPARKAPAAIPRPMSPRRQEQLKQKRRKKNKLRILTICILAAAVFAVLSLTVLFRIDTFEVSGETRYSREEILSSVGISAGENLFLANKLQAAAALLKRLPYLEQARVSIKLPSTIKITVSEATPVALISWEGQILLLSDKGKVLERNPQSYFGKPFLISGLEVSAGEPGELVRFKDENALSRIQQLLAAIEAHSFSGIEEITFTKGLSVTLNYRDRIQIELGAPTRFDEKVQMAAYVIANKLETGETGVLTLSSDGTKASFKPDYDTPSIVIPPGGTNASQPASSSSTGKN